MFSIIPDDHVFFWKVSFSGPTRENFGDENILGQLGTIDLGVSLCMKLQTNLKDSGNRFGLPGKSSY